MRKHGIFVSLELWFVVKLIWHVLEILPCVEPIRMFALMFLCLELKFQNVIYAAVSQDTVFSPFDE